MTKLPIFKNVGDVVDYLELAIKWGKITSAQEYFDFMNNADIQPWLDHGNGD